MFRHSSSDRKTKSVRYACGGRTRGTPEVSRRNRQNPQILSREREEAKARAERNVVTAKDQDDEGAAPEDGGDEQRGRACGESTAGRGDKGGDNVP